MAARRMFARQIIDSDAFLDLPLSTQALYFHLAMRADDDGFVNNPRKIQRMINASDDDCKLLVAKRFILTFDSGIIVIKHWRIHNYIRGDRKKDTAYPEEMSLLVEKENGSYTFVSDLPVNCLTNDCQLPDKCQHRIGKYSLVEYRERGDEDRIEGCRGERKTNPTTSKTENCGKNCGKAVENSNTLFMGKHHNVILTHKELAKLKVAFADWAEQVEKLSDYLNATGKNYDNHYDIITGWAGKDGNE